MTERRLFVSRIAEVGEVMTLDQSARHYVKVLRIAPGQHLELFDGAGTVASGEFSGRGVRILERQHVPAEAPSLTLLQALPKPQTCDALIRYATELGVARIVFFENEHYFGRHGAFEKRRARREKIAQEAARQSERAYVPTLDLAGNLDDALTAGLKHLPADAERRVCWARVNREAHQPAAGSARVVAVGPEGGFSEAELARFEAADFRPFYLGRHILRVDTAVAAALTLLAQ